MLKAIITRANADGTFDEVGMNNRIIIAGSSRHIRSQAIRYMRDRPAVRVEVFYKDNIYGEPIETYTINHTHYPNKP